MNFTAIKKLVQPDLTASKKLINNYCHSEVTLINDIASHLLNNNNKLIRPLVTILCAYLCGYNGKEHIHIAAALELLHTATLLHDDIIDSSDLRRGQISAHRKWGNEATVLVGDFLLAKSSEIITLLNNIEILTTLAISTSTIVEGEILQLASKNNLDIDEKIYFQIISSKTAKLFETAAKLPALLTPCSIDVQHNLAAYGLHLGIAFQLIDDLLDYQDNIDNKLGKSIGKDLTEGNITLPLIYLLTHGSSKEKMLVKESINTKNRKLLPELQTAIARSGAIAYTVKYAKQEATLAKQALSIFVDSAYKNAAYCLIDFVISRNY